MKANCHILSQVLKKSPQERVCLSHFSNKINKCSIKKFVCTYLKGEMAVRFHWVPCHPCCDSKRKPLHRDGLGTLDPCRQRIDLRRCRVFFTSSWAHANLSWINLLVADQQPYIIGIAPQKSPRKTNRCSTRTVCAKHNQSPSPFNERERPHRLTQQV